MSRLIRCLCGGAIATSLLIALTRPACSGPWMQDFPAATELYRQQNWRAAAKGFSQCVEVAPNAGAKSLAHFYTGECLVQMGDYAAARFRFEAVLRDSPHSKHASQALFRLGEAAWLTGDVESADANLTRFVAKYPTSSLTPLANRYLRKLSTSGPHFSKQLEAAIRLQRDGHYDAALAAYHALYDPVDSTQAEEKLRARALIRAAQLHEQLQQPSEAICLYNRLLSEFPHSPHVVAACFGLGEIARRTQNPTVAGAHFKTVQSKFPQTAQAKEAAYWLALAATDEKDSQTARRYVGWLIAELSPPKRVNALARREIQLLSHALYLQSQIAVAEGKWEEVSSTASHLLEMVGEGSLRTSAEFWLAEAAFRLGNDDLARERFAKLDSQVIGLDEAWVPMVPLRIAQLAAQRQQWTEVLERTDAIGRDDQDFPLQYEVDYLQGRALAAIGEMTRARRAYTRVLESRPAQGKETAAMAQWMIGESFFHQRDYERARRAYTRVIDEHDFVAWQARAALQAGKCWELEGMWKQAIGLYADALRRWPNVQSEKELKARIRWARQHVTSRPIAARPKKNRAEITQ